MKLCIVDFWFFYGAFLNESILNLLLAEPSKNEQRTIILTVLQYTLTISKKCGGKDKVLLLQYPVPNHRLYNLVFYLHSQQCFVEQSGKIIQSILNSHYFRSVESS